MNIEINVLDIGGDAKRIVFRFERETEIYCLEKKYKMVVKDRAASDYYFDEGTKLTLTTEYLISTHNENEARDKWNELRKLGFRRVD